VHAAPPSESDQIGWKFSLAGVGLKFSMLKETDRFTCPASGAGGDWIVKLPDKIYSGVPLNEYAMMHLANRIGIDVPEIKLVHRDEVDGLPDGVWSEHEQFAYAVRRFDRGNSREKIHIEDLAQVRGFYPEGKYLGNFETVASLLFRGFDTHALVEFTRRLTLNVLIGNGDAHLKNWSLIYRDRRRPTISPAYDIVATGLYAPRGEKHNLGLKFGGSRRFEDMRLATFDKLARRLNADVNLAEIANETVLRVIAEWPESADLLRSAPDVQAEVESSIELRSKTLRRGSEP
jgi:serine/threonine-protein kinase HipA